MSNSWAYRGPEECLCLPPTWTAQEFGKHSFVDRFSSHAFLFFRLQGPLLGG